jgi:hypothetical protein
MFKLNQLAQRLSLTIGKLTVRASAVCPIASDDRHAASGVADMLGVKQKRDRLFRRSPGS